MNNWSLLLFAFVAVFQPISSFTERIVDGRCSDRESNFLARSPTSFHGLRTKSVDERKEVRNEIRSDGSFLARLAYDRQNLANNRARDFIHDFRISRNRAHPFSHGSSNLYGDRNRNTENKIRYNRASILAKDLREESNRVVRRDHSNRYVRDTRESEPRNIRRTRFNRNYADQSRNERENRDTSLEERRFRTAEGQYFARRERENVVRINSVNEQRDRRVSVERINSERRAVNVRSNVRDENDGSDRRASPVAGRSTMLDRNRDSKNVRNSQTIRSLERRDRTTVLRSDSRLNRNNEEARNNIELVVRNKRNTIPDQETRRVRSQRDYSEERRERKEIVRNIRNNRQTMHLLETREQMKVSRVTERESARSQNERAFIRETLRKTDEIKGERRGLLVFSRHRDAEDNAIQDRRSFNYRVRSETGRIRDFVYDKPVGHEEAPTSAWRNLFYALQGAYVCYLLVQVTSGQKTQKQKARAIGWWFPTHSLKVE